MPDPSRQQIRGDRPVAEGSSAQKEKAGRLLTAGVSRRGFLAGAAASVAASCRVPSRVNDAASVPDGWETYAPRAEMAPRFRVEKPAGGSRQTYCLGMSGQGSRILDGRWLRKVPVTAGRHYQFSAEFRATNVAEPVRCVLARVVWINAAGEPIDYAGVVWPGIAGKPTDKAEYPTTRRERTADGWSVIEGTYLAPRGAAQARLELHLRWTATGDVLWRAVELRETAPPAPRMVRLAAVHHRPRGKSPAENLREFVAPLEEAGRRRADLVCLGEGITVVDTGRTYADVAEPVPGPTTEFLGGLAAQHRLYLVAGLCEREGTAVYNTAVLIGRDGRLAGRYRKVCLPNEEVDAGLTPGASYPVFDTDFGRIGIMICWDNQFPEVARELAARGAEVLVMPIWGGNETLVRARAIENQVFLVACAYDFKTVICGRDGGPLATAAQDPEVLTAEVDLGRKVYYPWLGNLRDRIRREMPERPATENGAAVR